MRRAWLIVPLLAMGGVLTGVAGQAPDVAVAQPSPVTFSKDVLPILQKNCQSCHRPGEIAPMSFLTYESTRPWAKAIKLAVLTKKMPPWFADPQDGQNASRMNKRRRFWNDRSLKQEEIDTLVRWVDEGAASVSPPPRRVPQVARRMADRAVQDRDRASILSPPKGPSSGATWSSQAVSPRTRGSRRSRSVPVIAALFITSWHSSSRTRRTFRQRHLLGSEEA